MDVPFVSVIMPVRNEGPSLEQSLRSVLAQDHPSGSIEVLVVDGGSHDDTRAIADRLGAEAMRSGGPNVRVLDNPRGITPAALNVALAAARGDVIVRVDGHCEIEADYVTRCVSALTSTGADCVGGLQRAFGTDLVSRAIAVGMTSPFGVGGSRFHYSEKAGPAESVYLGAYRREVFERIGGFDEELLRDQDDELNYRLAQNGGRIWLDPAIRSVYRPRGSFLALWNQYRLYGVYKVRVLQKRGFVSVRHLVPVAFVGGLAGTAVLSLVLRNAVWVGSVAGAYVVADLVATALAARRDALAAPLVPAVFATMHTAYGVGSLIGLWRFRRTMLRRGRRGEVR